MELMEFGRSLAALLLVLMLIGGGALLAKRYLPQLQATGAASGRRLQLLETMVLDPRNRLALVRVDDQELLVGLGQNGLVFMRKDEPQQALEGQRTEVT